MSRFLWCRLAPPQAWDGGYDQLSEAPAAGRIQSPRTKRASAENDPSRCTSLRCPANPARAQEPGRRSRGLSLNPAKGGRDSGVGGHEGARAGSSSPAKPLPVHFLADTSAGDFLSRLANVLEPLAGSR